MDELLENPFEKVDVRLGAVGGAEINWYPKPGLPFPTPWTFVVETAINPDAEWTQVGSAVSDATWALFDPNRYKYDTLVEIWYRVGLKASDNSVHYSDPVQTGSVMDRRDWVLAGEVCRRAYQRMRIRSGRPGWLLKRKQWGVLCPNCASDISGQASNSQCSICFGVGLTGGFYPPIVFPLEAGGLDSTLLENAEPGSRRYGEKNQILAVNFPRVDQKDVWWDADSDQRFAIQPTIHATTSHRGMPLIIALELQAIPSTAALYQMARPEIPSMEEITNPALFDMSACEGLWLR